MVPGSHPSIRCSWLLLSSSQTLQNVTLQRYLGWQKISFEHIWSNAVLIALIKGDGDSSLAGFGAGFLSPNELEFSWAVLYQKRREKRHEKVSVSRRDAGKQYLQRLHQSSLLLASLGVWYGLFRFSILSDCDINHQLGCTRTWKSILQQNVLGMQPPWSYVAKLWQTSKWDAPKVFLVQSHQLVICVITDLPPTKVNRLQSWFQSDYRFLHSSTDSSEYLTASRTVLRFCDSTPRQSTAQVSSPLCR